MVADATSAFVKVMRASQLILDACFAHSCLAATYEDDAYTLYSTTYDDDSLSRSSAQPKSLSFESRKIGSAALPSTLFHLRFKLRCASLGKKEGRLAGVWRVPFWIKLITGNRKKHTRSGVVGGDSLEEQPLTSPYCNKQER